MQIAIFINYSTFDPLPQIVNRKFRHRVSPMFEVGATSWPGGPDVRQRDFSLILHPPWANGRTHGGDFR